MVKNVSIRDKAELEGFKKLIKKIEEITEKELQEIISIWLESNIQTHHYIEKSYWEKNLSVVEKELPKAEIFVDKIDDKIVGFIGIMDGYIAGVFVEEAYRNQQIGKKLLKKAMELNDQLSLNVYEKNKHAIDFYLKLGFKKAHMNIDEETAEKELVMVWEAN
ncbi:MULTISPECIES: GNAT family N-acetyltransferase [Enterococcus]|uniref:GNAT family N-acetyltransferase n=1 Tax=Enterococcus TaxID=1350 RepID=UPI00255639CD|nr:GNAT family N-acetyltransferase [Enterococcus thailandicus]